MGHPINFAHIMPTSWLPHLGLRSRCELVLAHVAKDSEEYKKWFRDNPPNLEIRGRTIKSKRIMDNGAFELGASMDPDELIDLGKQVNATHLVLPDYPGEDSQKTIDAAQQYAQQFKDAGFQTIFVPQGRVGSVEDLDNAVRFGVSFSDKKTGDQLIDEIAMSIIAIPNAYGVYKNKTQRFLARWHYMSTFRKRDPNTYEFLSQIPIHMLGLLDGPNEIELIQQTARWFYNIQSWDSSAACWYAANNKSFDGSPTGSVEGKFELEVDFDAPWNGGNENLALQNMRYIDRLCGWSEKGE